MMNVEEKKENASNQNEENSNMKFEKKPETVEEKLQAKIEEQKEEIDEKDDRIKRLMAEFENFKKRSDKERWSGRERTAEGFGRKNRRKSKRSTEKS